MKEKIHQKKKKKEVKEKKILKGLSRNVKADVTNEKWNNSTKPQQKVEVSEIILPNHNRKLK